MAKDFKELSDICKGFPKRQLRAIQGLLAMSNAFVFLDIHKDTLNLEQLKNPGIDEYLAVLSLVCEIFFEQLMEKSVNGETYFKIVMYPGSPLRLVFNFFEKYKDFAEKD